MRILIAPDSYKESLSATNVSYAMRDGILSVYPKADIDICPMSDGGEGTIEAIIRAVGGHILSCKTTGPLNQKIKAKWATLPDKKTAIIEMAQTAGLNLVPPDRRDPTRTTTFGVGELIERAIDSGAENIIIGIGGSATNDGGTGMAQALGIRFYDKRGMINKPMNGGMLNGLKKIDCSFLNPHISQIKILAACDVTNPLTGANGAAAVYGPQKGATCRQIKELDSGLRHLVSLLPGSKPKHPGAGAAGGLGFGLTTFLGAEIVSGIRLMLKIAKFGERVKRADLVLTGEGSLDGQTLKGKVCYGVAQAALKYNVPTIAVAGSIGFRAKKLLSGGILANFSICDRPMTQEEAFKDAYRLIKAQTASIIKCFMYSKIKA